MPPAARNFLILFRGREGSSPIIDLLGRHPGINVPVFEHLDRQKLGKTADNDSIGRLVGLTFATGDLETALEALAGDAAGSRTDPRPVGFKWRIFGDPERVVPELAAQGVVIFHLFRMKLRQMVTSLIFTHGVIPAYEKTHGVDLLGGGHLQFKIGDLPEAEREAFRARLTQIRFRIEPADMIAQMRRIMDTKREVHRKYLVPLQALGVPVHAILYEDFVEQRDGFFASLCREIGVSAEPLQHTRTGYEKVLTQNPVLQVDNWPEVNGNAEVQAIVAEYRALVRKQHHYLRPTPLPPRAAFEHRNHLSIAVLTGGTSGLGRFVARGLVAAGHDLVLVARNPAKAEATRQWLRPLATAAIEIELADLSLLSETRRAAASIAARHPAIGILVLNAGMFQPRRLLTSEGHETVLAVNHLSPFVMMQSLSGALRAGSARVAAVGSSSSDFARIDPDNLELTRGWNLLRAYAQSKLAMMTTSFEWARRLAPEVRVNVVHPGTVATDLVRAGGVIGLAWRAIGAFVLSPEQGAAAPLRAVLDPDLASVTARYLKPSGFAAPNRRALDSALAARVWSVTEALVAQP